MSLLPPEEAALLRAANTRLRQVIEARDTEIAALRIAYQTQTEALRAQVEALTQAATGTPWLPTTA